MPVSYKKTDNGSKVQITITGRFDYRLSEAFRDTYRDDVNKEGVIYRVDLRYATSIDRAALGMLLLLREHAKDRGGRVLLEHPSRATGEALILAQFEQLFTISGIDALVPSEAVQAQ